MPATPLTTECRAVAERMRVFANCEGNVRYLQQLIYTDSATVASLIPELEAVDPPVDESVVQGLYQAASICGTVGECGGNVAMWPAMAAGADALVAACDAVEAASAEDAERQTGRTRRPASSADGRLG